MTTNNKMHTAIMQTCHAFRCGFEGQANEYLVAAFDLLLSESTTLSQQELETLNQLFPILMDAQQRRDTIYLADILQYEVLPLWLND